MDPGAQAGITDQLFGRKKAFDFADGAQNSHGLDQTDAGQLEQKQDLIGPKVGDTELFDFSLDLINHGVEVSNDGLILGNTQAFAGR